MIIQAVGKSIYIYILQENFTTCYSWYELLKRFSDIFHSYLVINQQRVTFPGVSIYFLLMVTNIKVVVCHFVQAKVTGISGLSFHTISSTFLRKNIHLPVRLKKSIFSDTNYHVSQKRTGCDPAAFS